MVRSETKLQRSKNKRSSRSPSSAELRREFSTRDVFSQLTPRIRERSDQTSDLDASQRTSQSEQRDERVLPIALSEVTNLVELWNIVHGFSDKHVLHTLCYWHSLLNATHYNKDFSLSYACCGGKSQLCFYNTNLSVIFVFVTFRAPSTRTLPMLICACFALKRLEFCTSISLTILIKF